LALVDHTVPTQGIITDSRYYNIDTNGEVDVLPTVDIYGYSLMRTLCAQLSAGKGIDKNYIKLKSKTQMVPSLV